MQERKENMEAIAYINALQAQATDLGDAVNRRVTELSEAKKRLLRLLDLQEEIDGWRRGSSRPRTNVGRFYSP